ncbi:MAG: sulfur carrier protein ThiS adenylyltransferase ThiF [Thermoplasmatales archaeon]|nr:sulfur carrier protein ThiS adenylyltransferase ThiF [Thermoplasmatales archaeon]
MNKEKTEKIKKKLKESCIGIAGLGGLGSNAAVALARAGIGRLILIDFDVIEESNLTRQYYFLDQIGEPKTIALQNNIKKINPNVIIDSYNEKLEKGSMEKRFKDCDVIIEALDSAETKTAFIEEILTKLPDKPVVAASGVAGYGHSDRITTKRLGNLCMCYDEQALSSDDDVLMAPRVAIMANWEANLAIEIILGEDK